MQKEQDGQRPDSTRQIARCTLNHGRYFADSFGWRRLLTLMLTMPHGVAFFRWLAFVWGVNRNAAP
jgi:hypothetical protein